MTNDEDEVLRTRVETLDGPGPEFVEVTAVGGDGEPEEVEILIGFCDVDGDHEDERPGQTCLYATPEQADRIAVALIQASDPTQTDRRAMDFLWEVLMRTGVGNIANKSRVEIGLALIRSAREP